MYARPRPAAGSGLTRLFFRDHYRLKKRHVKLSFDKYHPFRYVLFPTTGSGGNDHLRVPNALPIIFGALHRGASIFWIAGRHRITDRLLRFIGVKSTQYTLYKDEHARADYRRISVRIYLSFSFLLWEEGIHKIALK